MRNIGIPLTLGLSLVGFATLAPIPLAHAGAPKGDASYAIKVASPPAQKGQRAAATIQIIPATGYHFNKQYPTSITMTAPSGVTLDKTKLGAKDATKLEESAAVFDVGYTAASPGKKTVTGELKFSVCSASECETKKTSVSFDVDVK